MIHGSSPELLLIYEFSVSPWKTENSGGAETIGHLTRLENKWFVVQFFKRGDRAGGIATAFIPNRGQLAAMKNLMKEN